MSIASSLPGSTPLNREVPFSIELSDVGVRFRLPNEQIPSFKEYVLQRLKRRITYRDFWALKNISLQVRPGEIFGVVGRNGAGKSTMLKVVSRVLSPTEGRVVIRGNVAPLLELGAGFHPDLTGNENVLLNATILGHPRATIRKRLGEVMEFAELESFANAPVRTYSSGMRARLGFSVATLFRPDILVLDEVLAVGDLGFQEKCRGRLRDYVSRGTTVLLVSHGLANFKEYCKRVAWLDRGRIAAVGPAKEILQQYVEAIGDHQPRTTNAPESLAR